MISESKDLTTITVSTLFERLREFELELGRLKDEEVDKKKKGLALQTSSSHHEASDEDPS